jgi:hypothetical protein
VNRCAATAAVFALVLPATALAQDSVAAMCAELAAPEECACASEALLAEIGADDYALYESIGTDYVARMAGGEQRAAAWTAASAAVAAGAGISATELMDRTNVIGRAHRAAIDACKG